MCISFISTFCFSPAVFAVSGVELFVFCTCRLGQVGLFTQGLWHFFIVNSSLAGLIHTHTHTHTHTHIYNIYISHPHPPLGKSHGIWDVEVSLQSVFFTSALCPRSITA